ncbi:uncharacterized protein BHQ10_001366 [Talaromyces amestolkiae]|uniref:Mediator of RNA polymerase II transcription subunit 9 n=1 Tax=Talaromyces amestolkiae TaxID=1196081 RepID=A0A364KP74_TALAM|nr:uncharacterized protein BHQ10_001366 [Talaromyces amestolkiae]RAO65354.1 hypothetical protein BHQ10_001366 [Talaromyces amestolkiae]
MASRSPVSAVSQQQKISSTPDIAPTSPQPSAILPTGPQAAIPFPSPQTFDFIPPLHALILRLHSSTNTSASTAAAGAVTSQSTIGGNASVEGVVASQSEAGLQTQPQTQTQQKQSQSQLKSQLPLGGGGATDSATPSSSSNLPPLEAKDLFTAASAVRIRIQKARAIVESLPDVDRTTEEQDDEIEELVARIASLRGVIADFGRRAGMQQTIEVDKMDVGV